MADILKAFSPNFLIDGTRFAHCRRLQDDEAVAKITGMRKGRLCGEDAFRRLCTELDASQVEAWFAPAEHWIEAQANVPLFFSFLFKLKLTANVKRSIAAIPWDTWQGRSNEGLVRLAELDIKLTGWSFSRRVVVERTLKPLNPSPQGTFRKQCEEEFNAYATNLTPEEADAFQIVQLYRQRGD